MKLNVIQLIKYRLASRLFRKLMLKHRLTAETETLQILQNSWAVGLTYVTDEGKVTQVGISRRSLNLKYSVIANTVRHEVAHVLHMSLEPTAILEEEKHHGEAWKTCAMALGAKPEEFICDEDVKTTWWTKIT